MQLVWLAVLLVALVALAWIDTRNESGNRGHLTAPIMGAEDD
jgi:hypothetical protein